MISGGRVSGVFRLRKVDFNRCGTWGGIARSGARGPMDGDVGEVWKGAVVDYSSW